MNKYKEMFDKINISDECLRKVEHMEKNNHKIKKFRIRYVAVAAVMFAIFAMTDVVSYAATGNGITKHVHVFLDNNTEFVVLDFPYGKQKYNVGFRMEPEKDISPLSSFELRAVDFLEIDEWRFGSGWRLEISDEEPLYLVPLIREQFVMAVPRPLLGIYDQEGKQLGYGFSELTPGARNELRRIPLRVYYKYWKADVL